MATSSLEEEGGKISFVLQGEVEELPRSKKESEARGERKSI